MDKRRNQCQETNKTRYPTSTEAQEALSKIRNTNRFYTASGKRCNRRMKKAGQCRVYFCHHCNGFHMTSNDSPYTKKSFQEYKETNKKNNKDMVVTKEEAGDWKADSLPFPEQNTKS